MPDNSSTVPYSSNPVDCSSFPPTGCPSTRCRDTERMLPSTLFQRYRVRPATAAVGPGTLLHQDPQGVTSSASPPRRLQSPLPRLPWIVSFHIPRPADGRRGLIAEAEHRGIPPSHLRPLLLIRNGRPSPSIVNTGPLAPPPSPTSRHRLQLDDCHTAPYDTTPYGATRAVVSRYAPELSSCPDLSCPPETLPVDTVTSHARP